MKQQPVCQKADRCLRGKNCPLGYIPDTDWYHCFDRRKPIVCLEDCTKSELVDIIHYACGTDGAVKAAIDKGFDEVKHNRENEF